MFRLPDDFQSELNVPRLSGQGIQFAIRSGSSVFDEYPGAGSWFRRVKVGVIENVENLRSKLDVERLRNLRDVVVLGRDEIEV